MYEEKVLLIDNERLIQLKKEIKSEEQYYAFLEREGVTSIAVHYLDDTLRWVDKYDFIPG